MAQLETLENLVEILENDETPVDQMEEVEAMDGDTDGDDEGEEDVEAEDEIAEEEEEDESEEG